MRSAILALAGSNALLANAQAQAGQNTASGTEAFTPFQSTQATCLTQCHVADVGCRTKCINVHNPNVDPILATQECQAGCTQGDGSVAQTSAYGVCLQDCIDLYNVVSTVGGSATTATSGVAGSSASGSASGSTAAATTSIASSSVSVPAGLSGSVTASNAIASATATGSAAGAVRVGMTGLGLFGLLIVFFM